MDEHYKWLIDETKGTRFHVGGECFRKAEFLGCDFSGGVFSHSRMEECVFRHVSFRKSIFRHAQFTDCDITEVNWSGTLLNLLKNDPSTLVNRIHVVATGKNKIETKIQQE